MMRSALLLLCFVLFACAQPPVPDLPTQFQAKVTVTLPFVGTNPGVYYYDYVNQRVRYDLSSFFGTSTTIQRYDIAPPTEYDIFGGSQCQSKPLNDTMNSLDIPPFASFVAYEDVNSITCAHWKADFFGIEMDWWVSNSTDTSGKITYQIVKFSETVFGTVIIFGATIVGPVDFSYFDVSKYGCAPPVPPATYTVAGYVKNAVNNQVISGATVQLGSQTFTTGSDGQYVFESLTAEVYSIKASANGFYSSSISINVTQDVPAGTSADFSLSPTLSAGSIRAVLTWGVTPRDLDAHLKTPSGCEVNYRTRVCGNYASLDVDQTQGFGPETISLNLAGQTGTFTYYVYNYSGEKPLTVSGGRIQVFGSSGLLADFSVPVNGSTSYRFWSGFTVDQSGTVTVVNQLVASM